jgi:hypothetical protein
MSNRQSNVPSAPLAALLLLTGAATGALLTWAMTNGGREKLASLSTNGIVPEDMLNKAADVLRNTRDRIIEGIDSH